MTPPISMRELVERATPGPWTHHDIGHGCRIEPSVAWLGNTSAHPYSRTKANAQLIARLSPSVVLQVMDALEAIQKDAQVYGLAGATTHPAVRAKVENLTLGHFYAINNCLALLDGKNTEIKT